MDQQETPQKCYASSSDLQHSPLSIPATPCMQQIGYGTGVHVFRLSRSSHNGGTRSPWVIKRTIKPRKLKEIEERLEFEANLLKTFNHPNVVGFRDFVQLEDGRKCLAMENCTSCLGEIIEASIEDGSNEPLSIDLIIKVAFDVANALHYLHTNCKLMHGDVKSFNVLIKGNFEIAKLCDFGVSIPLDENGMILPGNVYTGTEAWSAPEVIESDVVSFKADIFSFGMVLWEMMSMTFPGIDSALGTEEDMSSDTSLSQGDRPDAPELGPEYKPIVDAFYWCTARDPDTRPSALELIQYFGSLSNKTLEKKM